MWIYNDVIQKWESNTSKNLMIENFNFLKQELYSTRFYSKFLSGATYVPVNFTQDLYEILGKWKPRSWYHSSGGSIYSQTLAPAKFATAIDTTSSFDFYTRFLREYGLTLKNLFTPERIIKDSLENITEVDLATTEILNLDREYENLVIDGVVASKNQLILVKDQVTLSSLDSTVDPDTYFQSNYYLANDFTTVREYSYYNETNGIYKYDGRSLIKQASFQDYDSCVRASVYVRSGQTNANQQFHLSRLLSGYYPTESRGEPMEFIQRKNWLLRHRVDYNNLYDINYFDVIRHDASQYYLNGVTYSIPQRTIAVGEFGVINVHQNGISNVVPNKYKINIRSISMTATDYWLCGDEATLLKVRKHDFQITRIPVSGYDSLKSVSFYNNQRGVVVGELNMILMTFDGGASWKRLRIADFAPYTYNKAIFTEYNRIFIAGRSGVFIEIEETASGWTAYKRRISKFIDDDDENVLVDNINDMFRTTLVGVGMTYNYLPIPISDNKDWLFLVTDGGNIVAYDISGSTMFDFVYLDLPTNKGDIINISRSGTTNNFYFSNNDGLYRFNISDFSTIGVGNSYSNTSIASSEPVFVRNYYANETFDYNGQSMVLAGNSSLLRVATYSTGGVLNTSSDFYQQDTNFESRLRSKLLFLDYDIASKLNFFTDSGDYRLPSSSTFDTMVGSTSSKYTFGSYTPTVMTTFGYSDKKFKAAIQAVFNNPEKTVGKLKEVRVTVSMTLGGLRSALTTFMIGSRVINKKPFSFISIFRPGQLKQNVDLNNVTFSSDPSRPSITEDAVPISGKIYRMDMVSPPWQAAPGVKVTDNNIDNLARNINGLNYIDGEYFLAWYDYVGDNKVFITSASIEFFFEKSSLVFKPRVYSAGPPSYVPKIERNWWTYKSDSEMTFPYYSQTAPSDSNRVFMSSTFSSYASYSTNFPYRISMTGSYVSTQKPDLDALFPDRYDPMPSLVYSGKALNLNTINMNWYSNLPVFYLWKFFAVLEVDKDWPVAVGDVIRLESGVVDASLVVNRIVIANRTVSSTTYVRKWVYMRTNFNDNIIKSLDETTGEITIRNLNRYLSIDGLVENFVDHPISVAYSLTSSSNKLTVSAKFNSETAYYNLGTSLNFSGVESSMDYQDSFIKFGYSPTYNLLDYLERVNKSAVNPTFYYDREYYALPVLNGLMMLNPFTANSVYIDSSGNTSSKYKDGKDPFNKIVFGEGLRFEWDSLMLNTFVDLSIYQPNATPTGTTFSTNRLLIMKKYEVPNYGGSGILGLVIEFHKRFNFQISSNVNVNLYNAVINIRSRRKLGEISDDLQELNNIQQRNSKVREISSTMYTGTFSTFERELNFKIPTDSYAKVLLSDAETVSSLSAVFYVDHKNELAMNITKLDREYEIPITNTADYNGMLMLSCGEKHRLEEGDGVVLDFTGGFASSQELNQQYFGHHYVRQVISEYDVLINTPYGNPVYIGNDSGVIRYLRKDPFMNYQPVDIIEVGSGKNTDISIKIEPENVKLAGPTFSLVNMDFSRYRFKLVDGLGLNTLVSNFPWFMEAEVSDAVVGTDGQSLVWYKGVWESGRWFGGTWHSGDWLYGDWYGGNWNSVNVSQVGTKYVVDKLYGDAGKSVWHTGRWYDGVWNDGTWVTGRWYGGKWNNGSWYNGIWNDGDWSLGRFIGGIWVDGKWGDGFFSCDNEPAFWIDGEWMSGDFENGIWYNGIFGSKDGARFGVNSSNSRTAVWHSGVWKSGSFHSGKPSDIYAVSDVHKYSIWRTGQWLDGDWYGGVAYNMLFNTGTWHGGILDEIQVIGMNAANNSFILNGVFRFNLGDIFFILDNNSDNEYSGFGRNTSPEKYTVLKTVVDTTENITEVFVNSNIVVDGLPSYKRYSGELNLQIPNNSVYLTHTQSVSYDSKDIKYIRVKLNLRNKRISDLIINIKSPNGQIMNFFESGNGPEAADVEPTNTSMVDTLLTTETGVDATAFVSPQTGLFPTRMSLSVGQVGNFPVSSTDDIGGLFSYDGSINGDWSINIWDSNKDIDITGVVLRFMEVGDRIRITNVKGNNFDSVRVGDSLEVFSNLLNFKSIVTGKVGSNLDGALVLAATASTTLTTYFTKETIKPSNNNLLLPGYGVYFYSPASAKVRSNPQPTNILVDWEIQFFNDYEVGAQSGYPRSNGIETGLRVVSDFRNVDWRSGIWSNGILDSGDFRGGIFLNGVFKGKMGI